MPAQAARRTVTLGRPSLYTQELADEIVRRTAAGESLRAICEDDHMPSEATVRGWDIEDRNGFSAHYARARALRTERWSEEIIELADEPIDPGDNAAVQRARLRVDTRKWLMSKLAPKKYGDRIEHVVRPGRPDELTDAELHAIAAPAMLTLTANATDDTETHDIRTDKDQ